MTIVAARDQCKLSRLSCCRLAVWSPASKCW